jgi:Ca2+-transporting ATPase
MGGSRFNSRYKNFSYRKPVGIRQDKIKTMKAQPATTATGQATTWHKLTIEETYRKLGSGQQGLSAGAAAEKLRQTGPNELEEGKKRSILLMLLAQFKDVMILILLAAAVVAGIVGDLTDTIVILVIVFLNAFLGFFQEFRAEKAMQALKQMAITQTRVFRDGHLNWLSAVDLVPGDVCCWKPGMQCRQTYALLNQKI